MIKRLVYTLIFLFGLLFCLICGLNFLFNTEAGTTFVLKKLQTFYPTHFNFQHAHGTLGSAITIQAIHYQDESMAITVENFHLKWHWRALLQRTLDITDLSAEKILIQQHSKQDQAKTAPLPLSFDFPWRLNIQNITLHSLRYTSDNKNYFSVDEIQGQAIDTPHSPLNIQIQWRHILLPIAPQKILTFNPGEFAIQGEIHHYQGHLRSSAYLSHSPPYDLSFHFNGNQPIFKLSGDLTLKKRQILTMTFDAKKTKIWQWQTTVTINDFNLQPYLQKFDRNFPLNLNFSKIHITAKANDNKIIRLESDWQTKEGMLNMAGVIDTVSPEVSLRLTGKNFPISDSTLMKMTITPDLQFNYIPHQLTLTGRLEIPKANIILIDQLSSNASLNPDVKIIEPTETTSSPLAVDAYIHLILGSDVHVSAYGLKGRLEGGGAIKQEPDKEATGEGRFEIREGEFNAYGKSLTIQTGKLLYFGGPIDNPGINLRAVKTFTLTADPSDNLSFNFNQQGQLILGIAAQGPLRHPQLSLFSDPPGPSQADILSMLLLGKPVNQLSSNGADVLLSASQALNLGGPQVSGITEQVKQTLGLDVATVDSSQHYDPQSGTTQTNTSLVLGKYLSPKIYIDYSMGLFGQTDFIQLSYLLNKHWSIKTQTGTASTGADLFYAIARD